MSCRQVCARPVEPGGWQAGPAPGTGRGSLECWRVMVAGVGRGLPDGAGKRREAGEERRRGSVQAATEEVLGVGLQAGWSGVGGGAGVSAPTS